MQTLSGVPVTNSLGIPYFHDRYFSVSSSFQPSIVLVKVFHVISCSSCLLIRKRCIITSNDKIIPPPKVNNRFKGLNNPSLGITVTSRL